MRRLLGNFWFQVLVFLAILGLTAVLIAFDIARRNHRVTPPKAVAEKTAEKPLQREIVETIAQPIEKFTAPPPPPVEKDPKPALPEEIRKLLLTDPSPISIIVQTPPAEPKPALSLRSSPPYRMIPVKLVTALESSDIDTPIVAITIEDLKELGPDGVTRTVIPAGVEVHGPPGAKSRMRDRIEANGTWHFVWRSTDEDNGLVLAVSGTALDRDYDPTTGIYGDYDGKAGIRGELLETTDNQDLKLYAAAGLSGIANGSKTTQTILNAFTGQSQQVPTQSLQNALLGGTDAVLQEYMSRIRKTLEEDGHYVRVRSGKQFYIYTRQPIDIANARRGGIETTQPDRKP